MKANSVLLAGGVVLALALWLAGSETEIRTEAWLDAPPAQVWAVLSDVNRYPEWNPVIVRLEGPLVAGQQVTFTNRSADGSEMTFHPRILLVQPAQELRWKGQLWLPGLFDGEHYFLLSPERGGTRLIHGEHFQGLLVPFVRGWLRGDIRDNFGRMNEALSQRLASQR